MNARDWVKLIPDAGAGTLLNEFVCFVKLMYNKYGSAIEMEEVLKGIIPILDDLHIEEDTSPSANKIEEFRQKLNDAHKRIASSSSRSLENLAGLSSLDHYVTNFSEKFGWVLVMSELRNMRREREGARKSGVPSLQTQQLPPHPVGLNVPVEDLKDRLFTENVKKVGVRAMGGGGKTTLAAALCQDSEVKGFKSYMVSCSGVEQGSYIKEEDGENLHMGSSMHGGILFKNIRGGGYHRQTGRIPASRSPFAREKEK